MKRLAAAAAAAVVVVVIAACGGKESDPGKGTQGSAGSAAPPPPPARVAPADAAYVVLRDKGGLVAIEDGAFRTVVDDKHVGDRIQPRKGGGLWVYVEDRIVRYTGELAPVPDVPPKQSAVAVGPDGTLWVSGEGLASYDGTAWKTHALPERARRRFVSAMAFAADGTRYGVAGTDLVIGRGDTWTLLDTDKRPVAGLAAAGDGTIYVSVRDQLGKLADDKLVPVAAVKGESLRLRTAPDGTVHAFGINGSHRIVAGKLEPLASMPFATGQTFGADGTLYGIPLGGMRIVRRRTDGKIDKLPADKDLPFQAKSINVDARDRLWLVLEYGMALLDGDKLTLLTTGTVPELSHNVDAIVVTGKGPDLPDVGPPKLINLKGTFVAKDKPKPGVKLELCPQVSGVFYGSSPCEGKGFVRRATSGPDGSFTVTDVPLGGWHIVYKKSADSWVFYFPPGCCGGLAKGATFDMGNIEFGKSSK